LDPRLPNLPVCRRRAICRPGQLQAHSGHVHVGRSGQLLGHHQKIQLDGFERYHSQTVEPHQFYGTLGNPSDTLISSEVYDPDFNTTELESLVAARQVLAPAYALHVAVEEHAQAVAKLGKATLREAVEFFLRHNRADVPRLTLAEIAEQFAKSREQSGLSSHYISQCRKIIGDLAKVFAGQMLPDLKTSELDAWLGGLPFAAKTKNGMRIVFVACGNWAEGRGYLVKGGSPFPTMVRYKETKSAVSIFTPGRSPPQTRRGAAGTAAHFYNSSERARRR
jgi:hypothetical protein